MDEPVRDCGDYGGGITTLDNQRAVTERRAKSEQIGRCQGRPTPSKEQSR
jgi:hypothetical protein